MVRKEEGGLAAGSQWVLEKFSEILPDRTSSILCTIFQIKNLSW